MIELDEKFKLKKSGRSSKGNQYKWKSDKLWYKADLNGYEGLAECVISRFLEKSTLKRDEFVAYFPETIKYKYKLYNGCKSADFLKKGESLITLERLYKSLYGESLSETLDGMHSSMEKLEKLIDFVFSATGIKNFGNYLSKIFLIDALFLNEDRHLHNIALIIKSDGSYQLSPIFDNAASLLSDMNLDYPLDGPIDEMMKTVKGKTISDDFDIQLDAAEKLVGIDMTFRFTEKDIEEIVNSIDIYDQAIKDRVIYILKKQRKRYEYFFE